MVVGRYFQEPTGSIMATVFLGFSFYLTIAVFIRCLTGNKNAGAMPKYLLSLCKQLSKGKQSSCAAPTLIWGAEVQNKTEVRLNA